MLLTGYYFGSTLSRNCAILVPLNTLRLKRNPKDKRALWQTEFLMRFYRGILMNDQIRALVLSYGDKSMAQYFFRESKQVPITQLRHKGATVKLHMAYATDKKAPSNNHVIVLPIYSLTSVDLVNRIGVFLDDEERKIYNTLGVDGQRPPAIVVVSVSDDPSIKLTEEDKRLLKEVEGISFDPKDPQHYSFFEFDRCLEGSDKTTQQERLLDTIVDAAFRQMALQDAREYTAKLKQLETRAKTLENNGYRRLAGTVTALFKYLDSVKHKIPKERLTQIVDRTIKVINQINAEQIHTGTVKHTVVVNALKQYEALANTLKSSASKWLKGAGQLMSALVVGFALGHLGNGVNQTFLNTDPTTAWYILAAFTLLSLVLLTLGRRTGDSKEVYKVLKSIEQSVTEKALVPTSARITPKVALR